MKSDIQIAQEHVMDPIENIAAKLDLPDDSVMRFGKHKAKVDYRLLRTMQDKPDGKLILVTAISPTPAGEGKTTTSIGLADALNLTGRKTALALREPSLGPVFGMKGGAAGGGYSQVVPMEDINLHFTGDMHAITAANNLLAAMIDNHIHQGNTLEIDPRRVSWKRCVDMNDRQLRFILDGLGGRANGTPREDGFDITVASEIMAIFCLATDIIDLKERLARIVIGYTFDGTTVTAGDLKAQGAMTALLKDAFNPNLVQTLEKTPAFIHGGPFANIAHGCNSVMATRMAMKLADYTVTEAGFGADLGAEKFIDIKCRLSGLVPSAVVIVATVRALKHHGGCSKVFLSTPDVETLKEGSVNLIRHIENIRDVYKLPVCVAINTFPSDSEEEHDVIRRICDEMGVPCELSSVFSEGGKGGVALADAVASLVDNKKLHVTYPTESTLKDKILSVCQKVYRADKVNYSGMAAKQAEELEKGGFGNLPICIAKTQYSFSDEATLLGAPSGFTMTVRSLRLCAGAGFIVVIMGNIMTMPGLPRVPSAENIDVDENGTISGLF